jgi:hypothetical protein
VTKDQVVDEMTSLNADLMFAFLASSFPILKIGIVQFLLMHFLKKWLRPMVNEGTVFVAFKAIDSEQMRKWEYFDVAKEKFKIALELGVPDEDSAIAFDDAFRRAIRFDP